MCLKYIAVVSLLAVITMHGQTVAPSTDQRLPTFVSKVPVVLVDIVVTDNHGNPISGLKQSDFQVFEKGKPQTIASFEEHRSGPAARAEAPQEAGVFTNSPSVVSADSINVLLIDGLNTSMEDQTFVRRQVLRYLKSIPQGAQVAVFILTTRLRMLQGFTTDSSALLAAVGSKDANALFASPLLQSEMEKQSLEQLFGFKGANQMGVLQGPDDLATAEIDAASVLKQAFAEMELRLTEERVRITLQSMQVLGRYLAPFPGRKNVMWVSGAFPIGFLPNSDLADPFFSVANFRDDIQRTADLLTTGRVAIYPVAAQGLMGDRGYQANAAAVSTERPGVPTQLQPVGLDPQIRASMEKLAKNSGGRAFYNTNGVGDVLTRVTNNSANFYTLSYTPTDRQMDGKYRPISIKLTTGKGRLSYRRGYFALPEEDASKAHEADPLTPVVLFGMPDISQVVYKVRVAPVSAQDQVSPLNDVSVPAKEPVRMYALDLEIFPDQLQFVVTPDGVHHGKIDLKFVLYDQTGKALNIAGGSLGLSFKPDRFEKLRREGLQLRQQIEIPESKDVSLYTGIRDLNSGRIGTLAVTMRAPNRSAANK